MPTIGASCIQRVTCAACGLGYTHFAQHARQHGCGPPPERPPAPLVRRSAAPDMLANFLEHDSLRSEIVWDLGGLRLDRHLRDADIGELKGAVNRWHASATLLQYDALVEMGLLDADAKPEAVLQALRQDLFTGIGTSKREAAQRQQDTPALQPRIAHSGGGEAHDPKDMVVSFNVARLIEYRMQKCARFRRRFLEESDRLKSGDGYRTPPPDVVRSYRDGLRARYHPHLMRPATEEEADDVRGAIVFNCDDVEVSPTPPAAIACA